MSGGLPDVRGAVGADDGGHGNRPQEENSMVLVQVHVIAGVFTAQQKREMVQRLTGAMVEVAGESMRRLTWCLVEEVASDQWGVGGHPHSADDVKALERG
jgi:4-oxalocrotonate tautomerase